MYIKGDILLPINQVNREDWLNGLFHPAIVWDQHYDGNSDFHGIMITHSNNQVFNNILMDTSHFELDWQILFSNTHFVNQIFIKFQMWGDFRLVGRLTADGITFIENRLTNIQPIEFRVFRDSLFS